MAGFNLPPGVSVNDIPGNRPEDDEDGESSTKVGIQTYRDRRRAERACALKSRNAHALRRNSQVELRQLGPNGFVGGYPGDLAKRYPKGKIIGQWSGGYRVDES